MHRVDQVLEKTSRWYGARDGNPPCRRGLRSENRMATVQAVGQNGAFDGNLLAMGMKPREWRPGRTEKVRESVALSTEGSRGSSCEYQCRSPRLRSTLRTESISRSCHLSPIEGSNRHCAEVLFRRLTRDMRAGPQVEGSVGASGAAVIGKRRWKAVPSVVSSRMSPRSCRARF